MSVDPFAAEVPEVHLARAPLAKVLAQVRYPRPVNFQGTATVDRALKALAPQYPVVRERRATAVLLTPEGVSQQPAEEPEWTLDDLDGHWRVTISDKFTSIETSKYVSRDDFVSRVQAVLNEVSAALDPPVFDRLGIRYINRLEGAETADELPLLIQPIGMGGLGIPRPSNVSLVHSLSDTLFQTGGDNLQVRWGWLPAGATLDPTLPAPNKPYWLLDLDVFTSTGGRFSVEDLTTKSLDFCNRAHSFFRWMITKEFIERYGSE